MEPSRAKIKYAQVAKSAEEEEQLHSAHTQKRHCTCRIALILSSSVMLLFFLLQRHLPLQAEHQSTSKQPHPSAVPPDIPLHKIPSTQSPTEAQVESLHHAPDPDPDLNPDHITSGIPTTLAPSSSRTHAPVVTAKPTAEVVSASSPSLYPSPHPPDDLPWRNDVSKFVNVVSVAAGIKKRRKRMAMLDEIKAMHCSGYQLSSARSNWKKVTEVYYLTHYDNNMKMRAQQFTKRPFKQFHRKVCHARHPTRADVTISIERAGPLVTHGDYDWTQVFLQDVGHLSQMTKGKVVYVVGGMFAPVDVNGTVIGYPPLHIHHAHLFPYGTREEIKEKIKHGPKDASPDQHDVLIQSHGDSECALAQGGVACMLTELEEGLGFRIVDSQTGFLADFTINDVRKKIPGLPPLEYYVEHVVFHTEKKMKPVTYLSLNAPVIPWSGPATYMIPVDESSTLMYYHFPNSFWGAGGRLQDFVFHTHQTFVDAMWLFKGKGAYEVLEAFRNGAYLPLILECHGHELNRTKTALFRKLSSVAQAVCVINSPNLQYSCKSKSMCGHYDKRMDYKCVNTSISFEEDEVLTLVAFNRIHRLSGKSWRESRQIWKQHANPYTKYYAAYQHSVFRAVFVPETDATPNTYVPPAYFYYSHCHKDAFPGPHPYRALKKLQQGCPATISFY